MVDLVTGDTGSVLRVTCIDSGTGAAIVLTGATVSLKWYNSSGTLVTKVITIEDAANGIVSYQFVAGEIFFPKMKFEVEITDSLGQIISSLSLLELTVREQLG